LLIVFTQNCFRGPKQQHNYIYMRDMSV